MLWVRFSFGSILGTCLKSDNGSQKVNGSTHFQFKWAGPTSKSLYEGQKVQKMPTYLISSGFNNMKWLVVNDK
jgi:hypothetical protein